MAKDFFENCLHKYVDERFHSMNDVIGHPLFQRANDVKGFDNIETLVNDRFDEMKVNADKNAGEIRVKIDKLDKMLVTLLLDQNVPRFPYMIPRDKEMYLDINKFFTKSMRITFLCPITKIIPRHHDGSPKGYDITLQKGWVKKYGPALLASLEVLKVLCAVGRVAGLPLPNLNSVGPNTNIIDVAIAPLIDHMRKEDVTAKVKDIGNALNDRVTVNAGISEEDYSEEELNSFVNIKRLAEKQDDSKFYDTGLVKVVRVKDGKVEYVLNDPYVIKEYKEGRLDITNDQNPINLTLAKGVLEKQVGNKWCSRYLVLNRFGFLSSYHTKDKFDSDKSKVKGKMKKIDKIEKVGTGVEHSDRILKVTYYDDDERTFKAANDEEREKWINAMSS